MGKFITTYSQITDAGKPVHIVDKTLFRSFNESILDLGNIESASTRLSALSVMFDLEGFTSFCNQIDPHLAVPEYLSEFLKWLFNKIKEEIVEKVYETGYKTYCDFPFLSKYLGDGVLFLWDTKNMSEEQILDTVITIMFVCESYVTEFLPMISKKIVSPPPKMRAGIARGDVYSVGDGRDYVGPCINMAARLQKINSLTLCFSRRGLNPDNFDDDWEGHFIVKKVNIRGIGPNELICMIKTEYESLSPEEKKNFAEI